MQEQFPFEDLDFDLSIRFYCFFLFISMKVACFLGFVCTYSDLSCNFFLRMSDSTVFDRVLKLHDAAFYLT